MGSHSLAHSHITHPHSHTVTHITTHTYATCSGPGHTSRRVIDQLNLILNFSLFYLIDILEIQHLNDVFKLVLWDSERNWKRQLFEVV